MTVYYNEFDPKAAAWLRELIKQGHLPAGVVDERSIVDVKPGELKEFTQCHFFAGIGGWPYALALAGWPVDRPVWTGSCPCQPFSVANSRRKAVDDRDLFGTWADLIRECRPPIIFGEQVASPLGLAWFDTVRTDLENEDYAVAGADLCAASVGAPHIRQRLYWLAVAGSERLERERLHVRGRGSQSSEPEARRSGEVGQLAIAHGEQRHGDWDAWRGRGQFADGGGLGDPCSAGSGRDTGAVLSAQGCAQGRVRSEPDESEPAGADGQLADTDDARSQGRGIGRLGADQRTPWESSLVMWIPCRDGKWRPAESGAFPLAHGVPSRVGLLRGYGNAIVPQVAAAFIEASGLL